MYNLYLVLPNKVIHNYFLPVTNPTGTNSVWFRFAIVIRMVVGCHTLQN